MSITCWPIVLYGVRCDKFKIKKEYCDEEGIGRNDVWDFLCSFYNLFNSFGLVAYHGGRKEIYIGIPPKYTWNGQKSDKYKTKSDANKVIVDFMFKYFEIGMSKKFFIRQIRSIETCGYE